MPKHESYWNELVQQGYEEKLEELELLVSKKKDDSSFSFENYVPEDGIKKKKKKNKKEQFSLQMNVADLRKLFAIIKEQAGDLHAKFNNYTSTNKNKKDKDRLMIELLSENLKAYEIFSNIRAECKKHRVAHDNRVVKSDPVWVVGSSVVLLGKFLDDYINVAYGTLKSVPVVDCDLVQVEIKDDTKHRRLFVNTTMDIGSTIDYPWNLLSKDKTEEGININNQLLSNPSPSRRSITPVNNQLGEPSQPPVSVTTPVSVEPSQPPVTTTSTPPTSIVANSPPVVTPSTSSPLNVTPLVGLSSRTISSVATPSTSSPTSVTPSTSSPPLVGLSSGGGSRTTPSTSSPTSVTISPPPVVDLSNNSPVGNTDSRDDDNDESDDLLSNLLIDGEEPCINPSNTHIVHALFCGTDIHVPTSSKPYWTFRAVEAKKLIDNLFALYARNSILEKALKSEVLWRESITKLVDAKNRSSLQLLAQEPSSTSIDLVFDDLLKISVSDEEFEKFKKNAKTRINEAIDQVMAWFGLQEIDLKNKKEKFDLFLLQHCGHQMSESTIRNRAAYILAKQKKRKLPSDTSADTSAEPTSKSRKVVSTSASSAGSASSASSASSGGSSSGSGGSGDESHSSATSSSGDE